MTNFDHRLAIGFSRETYEGLSEIARLEQSSLASVVRDCVRTMLPQFLGVTRMIHDPANTPEQLADFADQMERAINLTSGLGGVPVGDGSGPPDLPSKSPNQPPFSNRGVKS